MPVISLLELEWAECSEAHLDHCKTFNIWKCTCLFLPALSIFIKIPICLMHGDTVCKPQLKCHRLYLFLQVSHINGIIAFEFTASQLSIEAFRSQKRLEGVRIHSIHFQYISSRKFMFISHVNISHSHKHDQFETFIGLLASLLGLGSRSFPLLMKSHTLMLTLILFC